MRWPASIKVLGRDPAAGDAGAGCRRSTRRPGAMPKAQAYYAALKTRFKADIDVERGERPPSAPAQLSRAARAAAARPASVYSLALRWL